MSRLHSVFPTIPGEGGTAAREFYEVREFNPDRTRVYDRDTNASVAVFTDDCRTVVMAGRQRTLVEQVAFSDAVQDDFDRTIVANAGASVGGWGNTYASGRWNIRSGDDWEYSVAPGVATMQLNSVGSSRRIAPSSYGYDYEVMDIRAKVRADQLASDAGGSIFASTMFGYNSIDNHYYASLRWKPGEGVVNYYDAFGTNSTDSWGTSDDADAKTWISTGTATNYQVTSGYGTHLLSALNSSRRTYVTAPSDQHDGEVLSEIVFPDLQTGGSIWAGPMLRYDDISNHYTVRLRKPYAGDVDNSTLDLQKTVGGSTYTVVSVDIGEQVATGATWFVRARIVGDHIQARAWKSSDSEPGTWDLDLTDASLTTGNEWGVRSIASTNVSSGTAHTVRYLSFDYNNLGTAADETYIALEKREFGVESDLAASVNILTERASVDDEFWIRARMEDGTLYAKAWADGDSEPEWQITVEDSSFPTGDVGLRGYLSIDVDTAPINLYWSDYAVDARWINPPTIVHDQWVRIMDEAYNTDAGVPYTWLRDQLPSDDEDVISWAMSYLANVPDTYTRVPSSRNEPNVAVPSSTKVAGECAYGAADSEGYRIEGSDWNDYIQVTAPYPTGDDVPEAQEDGCLDCSGFVRMVYGYRGGLPMERTASDDGVHIPRVSTDIQNYGPGIVVFATEERPTQTEFDKLQIGDVVSFDAGVGDPDEEEGEIDHNGIYLGVDNEGLHRFVSSRKTVNGPTMSDIGGLSILDTALTNLYSVSFRAARRF